MLVGEDGGGCPEARGSLQVLLSGGVAANGTLRTGHGPTLPRTSSTALDLILCTDNAAMIAACGYFRLENGERAGWDLEVYPNLTMALPGKSSASLAH